MNGEIALILAASLSFGAPRAQSGQQAPVAIVGEWELNLARTRFGPSADRPRSEHFSCVPQATQVRCVIRSVRADGRTLVGRFTAPLDGTGAPVTGIPDIDQVQLRRPSAAFVDATFLSRGKPIFGYRALQSIDARSLTIVAVDPVSRATLTTVVVYDRR